MLRVLVADDELLARKRLIRLLGDMDDIEVVGDVTDGAQVLKRVALGDVDCVLLDIHMPHLTGLDALQLLPAGGASVVFVTAHSEHAVEAFDGDAVDYVLKPVQADRLARALDRVRARRGSDEVASQTDAPQDPNERLAVTTAKGLLLIAPSEITHAIIDGETVEIHGDRGVVYTELRLAELERRLPTPPFERLHRRSLVNMDRIARLEPLSSGGYLAHTDLGAVVDVSRKSARNLRKRFGLS